MHHPILNLLRLPYIPELLPQIATGTANDIHFSLIFVVTLGTFSASFFVYEDFSVVVAFVAVVRFGVKFCVLDIFVDKFNHCLQRFKVFLHIRDFYERNRASGGDSLELGLELQFGECINRFADIYVVGISIIAFVCHVFNFSEASFVNLGEAVAQGFSRGSVEGKSDSCFSFSGIGCLTEFSHGF